MARRRNLRERASTHRDICYNTSLSYSDTLMLEGGPSNFWSSSSKPVYCDSVETSLEVGTSIGRMRSWREKKF